MEHREYDTLPFKTFYKILSDESDLTPLGIENKEESEKVWKSIKEEWKARNPSARDTILANAHKKVLLETLKMNKDIAFLKFSLIYDGDMKQLCEDLGYKWAKDQAEQAKNTLASIEKAKIKRDIFGSKLKTLSQDMQKEKDMSEGNTTLASINKSIASLEMNGFTIQNYETLTCGKYDAMTEVIKQKISNG